MLTKKLPVTVEIDKESFRHANWLPFWLGMVAGVAIVILSRLGIIAF